MIASSLLTAVPCCVGLVIGLEDRNSLLVEESVCDMVEVRQASKEQASMSRWSRKKGKETKMAGPTGTKTMDNSCLDNGI